MNHICKHGGLPDWPRALFLSSFSATHLSELSSVPWELVGSLSLQESQAHLAWAFLDGRSRDTFFQAPKGPDTQFRQLILAGSPQSLFLGLRTWGSGKDVNSGHV